MLVPLAADRALRVRPSCLCRFPSEARRVVVVSLVICWEVAVRVRAASFQASQCVVSQSVHRNLLQTYTPAFMPDAAIRLSGAFAVRALNWPRFRLVSASECPQFLNLANDWRRYADKAIAIWHLQQAALHFLGWHAILTAIGAPFQALPRNMATPFAHVEPLLRRASGHFAGDVGPKALTAQRARCLHPISIDLLL